MALYRLSVPYCGNDDGAGTGDPQHFRDGLLRPGYEVEHQVREDAIEAAICQLEIAGVAGLEFDTRVGNVAGRILDVSR
jgi:hypothetical protein